jgi:hypothetical protein
MASLLEMLERMASSEYYEGTPDSYRAKETEGSLMYSDPYEGLSAEEREMYGEDGITDDVEYELVKGTEAGYKKDIDSFLNNLAKGGKDIDSFLNNLAKGGIGKGPVPVKPIQGRPPPTLSIPERTKGFRPTESPYGIPSELATQEALQQEISRRIAKQLEQTIVKRPYLNFQGLI